MVEKYFGEFQIDKIIRENYFPEYQGIMVEVGGGKPDEISISKHFILNGWRSLIIEPNPLFAAMHRYCGNEVYEYACSFSDQDDIEFQVVRWQNDYHSFSSLKVKEEYMKYHNMKSIDYIPIKVKVRMLDSILKEAEVEKVDFLSVDTEGWELEVMKGLTLKPRIVLLENYLHNREYTKFMVNLGYKLDKKVEYNYIYVL